MTETRLFRSKLVAFLNTWSVVQSAMVPHDFGFPDKGNAIVIRFYDGTTINLQIKSVDVITRGTDGYELLGEIDPNTLSQAEDTQESTE